MHISHVSIRNFKHFRHLEIDLRPGVNIVVGDNDTGKTTLLEAIHLCLTGQYRGRQLADMLSPHIFNKEASESFFSALRDGKDIDPPEISICLTLTTNRGIEKIRYSILPDEAYLTLLRESVADCAARLIPVQFYTCRWETHSGQLVKQHLMKLESCLIDNSPASHETLLAHLLKDNVNSPEFLRISNLRDTLSRIIASDDTIAELNALLSDETRITSTESHLNIGTILDSDFHYNRLLSVEADGIPIAQSGSGTRSSLALRLAAASRIGLVPSRYILLIEQPEQNLSFSSLQRFTSFLAEKFSNTQIVISTLSSYIANKLGLDSLILLSRDSDMSLSRLDPDTIDFFHRLNGYDTLRFILAKRTLLVEGDSDELIVQRAYLQHYGRLPEADGIDIQSVRGLSFQRYLRLALPLRKNVGVLTDSDGFPEKTVNRFKELIDASDDRIRIYVSHTVLSRSDFSGRSLPPAFNFNTLEPMMLRANSTSLFNKIFHTSFAKDSEMLHYMSTNKSECALMLYKSDRTLSFPDYILRAIEDLHSSSVTDNR